VVRHGHSPRNPVGEVERPAINRDEGVTAAFSKTQARKLLDLPLAGWMPLVSELAKRG
jgi:hypothetical protein